jgi:hypothetical protein
MTAALARHCEPNEATRFCWPARERIACKEFWETRDSGYTAPLAYERRGVTSAARALNLALGHAHVNAVLQFRI